MSNNEQQSTLLPPVRVARYGVLKIYPISDDELTRLGQGSGQSLFLNFGIGVFTVAVSFLISLLTITITPDRLFDVFVIVTVVCFLASIVFMVLWWCTRKPISKLVQEIRDRMPPEGETQQLAPPYSERCADAPSNDNPSNVHTGQKLSDP